MTPQEWEEQRLERLRAAANPFIVVRPVTAWLDEDTRLRDYDDIATAAAAQGVNVKRIINGIARRSRVNRVWWTWKGERMPLGTAKLKGVPIEAVNAEGVTVIWFESLVEAASKTPLSRTAIYNAVHERMRAGGYHWRKSRCKSSPVSPEVQREAIEDITKGARCPVRVAGLPITFPGIRECAIAMNATRRQVENCLNRGVKLKGLKIERADDSAQALVESTTYAKETA